MKASLELEKKNYVRKSLELVNTDDTITLKEANSKVLKEVTWKPSKEKAPWVATKDSEEKLSELGFKVKDIGFSKITGEIDSFSVAYNKQTYLWNTIDQVKKFINLKKQTYELQSQGYTMRHQN